MMREVVIQLIEEWSYIYTCPAAMGALAWRREAMPCEPENAPSALYLDIFPTLEKSNSIPEMRCCATAWFHHRNSAFSAILNSIADSIFKNHPQGAWKDPSTLLPAWDCSFQPQQAVLHGLHDSDPSIAEPLPILSASSMRLKIL